MKKHNQTSTRRANFRAAGRDRSAIHTLGKWCDAAILKNRREFIEQFTPHADILVSIHWNDESMNVVYTLASGKHVSESFPMSEWIAFYEKHK